VVGQLGKEWAFSRNLLFDIGTAWIVHRLRLLAMCETVLGNRKEIEEQTTTWDKTVIDRTGDLKNWVEVFKSLVSNTKVLKIFAFSNNHLRLMPTSA
jgi:hypothetical protein